MVMLGASTSGQEELSPDSQAKLLKEFAKKNGMIVLQIFYELGISGRKADKRPEFQKMIALAKSDKHPSTVSSFGNSADLQEIKRRVYCL